MKVPISKQITENVIILCIAIAGVGLYDLCLGDQKRFGLNVAFIVLFGIPALLFAWFLLDKRIEFKDNTKVRAANRLIKLPFSSFVMVFIFVISSFFLVAGLARTFGENESGGLTMILTSVSVMALIGIAVDHPKIWLSDTFNLEDMMENIENTPQENFPAYQDGIFSYGDSSFSIQLNNETKTIQWNDISLIRAYKIDQFAVDCIVIEIYVGEAFISINDQTPGHMKFMEAASSKLSNFKNDWFMLVAFPAFETNLTTIFEKEIDEKNKPTT